MAASCTLLCHRSFLAPINPANDAGGGGEAGVPQQIRFQVEDWLEWEERVLRPATQAAQGTLLQVIPGQILDPPPPPPPPPTTTQIEKKWWALGCLACFLLCMQGSPL